MIYIIFSFLFVFINNKHYITIPFQNYLDESNENIMKSLFFSNIHYNLTIGTPNQNIPILIKFNYFYFSLNGKNSKNSYYFNEDLSKSYVQLSNRSITDNNEFYNGFESEDKLLIDNKDYRLYFYCSNNNYNHNIFGGTLGLSILKNDKKNDFNFIYYMVKKNIIDDYSVSISYSNKNEGILSIGSYLYKRDKNYKESDFKSDKSTTNYWTWNVKAVIVGEKSNLYTKYLYHYPELGVLIGNRDYYDYITDFFNKYNECKKESVEIEDNEINIYNNLDNKNIYYYYKCSKDFQINKLDSILFDLNIIESEFKLDYNDLFYEYKNSYYFLIIFPTSIEEIFDDYHNSIVLGSPFYKKYNVTFDMERKLIGVYKKRKYQKKNTSFSAFIFLFILFCFILILLYYVFYIKKISLKKYKFKNIFNDEFEYRTSDYSGLK